MPVFTEFGHAGVPMIEVKNLTRYYGSFRALSDVSFTLNEGEIIGLLGLNGAGKSTTLKILAGLIAPSEGSVFMGGVDVALQPDAMRSQIGYLPEDPPLYKDMSVVAFLSHIGRLKGMSRAQVDERIGPTVSLAQLEGREGQLIGTLSHGYRKRVGIAQAVLHDPKLVILDEPISGLDPRQIVGMRKVIRGLAEGRAVIVSSHILGEISQTCDRILVINNGVLAAEGTESQLAGQAKSDTNRLRFVLKGEAKAFHDVATTHPTVASTDIEIGPAGTFARMVTFNQPDGRVSFLAALLDAKLEVWEMTSPDDDLEELFLDLTGDAT